MRPIVSGRPDGYAAAIQMESIFVFVDGQVKIPYNLVSYHPCSINPHTHDSNSSMVGRFKCVMRRWRSLVPGGRQTHKPTDSLVYTIFTGAEYKISFQSSTRLIVRENHLQITLICTLLNSSEAYLLPENYI